MPRLLITGGSGYLGARLIRAAQTWEVCSTYYTHPFTPERGAACQLNLEDEAAVHALLRELKPTVIVHTACSNRNADQIRAIAPAARHLAQAACDANLRLIHVSSDTVFDGEHAPYTDAARPNPISEYGRAKAEAEAIVTERCPSALIVRPSLIWSLQPIDHQTRWLVEGVQSGQTVTLFIDEFRNPVYLPDLAAALLELAERPDLSGPLNLGGPQALCRWDFGIKLLAALHINPGEHLHQRAIKGAGLLRPRDLTMISARAAQQLHTRLRSVDDVLGQAHP